MSDFSGFRRYVTLPGRKRARIVRDVDDELENHLAMRAAALERKGATPDDARAQALREFGDLADARQYCVEVSHRTDRRAEWRDWLSDARLDAGHSVRLMRRFPAFTTATIAVFAAAIAASTAANSVLRAYLIRPLLLAALGLYTSLSYLVEQRQVEFAVRMAVGAESAAIVGLVMAEGVAPVVGALVTGTGLSLALGRVLEHQVFGVNTRDLPTLGAICAVLVLSAAAAMLLPARRATRTDPSIALRG